MIELYCWLTPNGQKSAMLLEEVGLSATPTASPTMHPTRGSFRGRASSRIWTISRTCGAGLMRYASAPARNRLARRRTMLEPPCGHGRGQEDPFRASSEQDVGGLTEGSSAVSRNGRENSHEVLVGKYAGVGKQTHRSKEDRLPETAADWHGAGCIHRLCAGA